MRKTKKRDSTDRELRLALRALRVARRHLSQAVNLNPMRVYEMEKLREQMKRFGREERELVGRIGQPSYR